MNFGNLVKEILYLIDSLNIIETIVDTLLIEDKCKQRTALGNVFFISAVFHSGFFSTTIICVSDC